MINSVTTLEMPLVSASRVIKIESKQTKSQCVPYFFASSTNIKKGKKNVQKTSKNNNQVKKIIISEEK